MQNFLLTLAYDGTNYCGFQVQPNGRSVAATFQDALEAVLGSRPDIRGCSRTDAGVHALGFRLNFHADTRIPPQKLPLALNQHLPPDIRVLAAQTVPEDFHARYAAHTKTYLYRIHNHPIDSPFDAAYYTRVPRHLDEARMQAAAQQFVREALAPETEIAVRSVEYVPGADGEAVVRVALAVGETETELSVKV